MKVKPWMHRRYPREDSRHRLVGGRVTFHPIRAHRPRSAWLPVQLPGQTQSPKPHARGLLGESSWRNILLEIPSSLPPIIYSYSSYRNTSFKTKTDSIEPSPTCTANQWAPLSYASWSPLSTSMGKSSKIYTSSKGSPWSNPYLTYCKLVRISMSSKISVISSDSSSGGQTILRTAV